MQQLQHLYDTFIKFPLVTTDSRKIVPGCLFFALKGDRFNGNEFAQEAINQGAAFAIIDEDKYDLGKQYFLVENVLQTLQELANYHRRQFQIPLIAITGSNGKTTTKELVSAVLSSHYRTHYTKGNFNNHIGVPLTLLDMALNTEVAIIEMGANHQGEIAALCQIAEPTHGLITNIGKAHLEGFGGIEGVKAGKSELYHYLATNNGVAFVNQDEPHLEELVTNVKWKIFYKKGEIPHADNIPFEVQLISNEPFIKAAFATDHHAPVTIESQLIGEHNFNNIMTAAVLGTYFKVTDQKIKAAIEGYVPANNRSQLVSIGSNTFVLDAYNANPTSMRHALAFFGKMNVPKKVVILGAMKELGAYSELEHRAVVEQALACGFEQVVFVGEEYKGATELVFENIELLKDWFVGQHFQNTHFLIKGSRSIGLEEILEVAQ